jgi:predicted regulator of Ras-like GTPase activity (Roadblock/LC7/MglB family)
VEAAIILSGNGLPLAWHTRKDSSVEEVLAVCTALLAAARELHLFDTSSHASMVFDTAFGALHMSTIDAESLLLLCLTGGYSLLTINSLLERLSCRAA